MSRNCSPGIISTCGVCGTEFEKRAHNQKYCSKKCANLASWYQKEIVCKWCGAKVIARRDTKGFCSKSCVSMYFAQKRRDNKKPKDHWPNKICKINHLICKECGEHFIGRTAHTKYCRGKCRAGVIRRQQRRNVRRRFGYRLHNITCPICGASFVSIKSNLKYCSDRCRKSAEMARRRPQRADWNRRRRARLRGATVERFASEEIFQRDGWRCQICKKRVLKKKQQPHPRAPTIDHIVPLSEGGAHERKNVQCACFLCNSTKGCRTLPGGEQLRLFG